MRLNCRPLARQRSLAEQNVDMLLLDQDIRQSQYPDSQRFDEVKLHTQHQQGSDEYNFQSLSLD